MTSVIDPKRRELLEFIRQVLEPEPSVQAVIAIGSLASGLIQPDSDVDLVIFFDPLDWYVVPGEFIWRPSDGTFHSIFTEDQELQEAGIEFDCLRLDLSQWRDPNFDWPEGRRAELAGAWIAFDREGTVRQLIDQRTAYSDTLRQERLDEALIWLDQHLYFGDPFKRWQKLGTVIAHDRLQAAYQYLARALFAHNRRWLPWRNRQMSSLLRLKWLPRDFEHRVLVAANAPTLEYTGYEARVLELRSLFDDLLAEVVADGTYMQSPVEEAFIRSHDQPGYAWNMAEWNEKNRQRSGLLA